MFKTDIAYENWKSKYRYDNEEPLETFKRIADALASVEKDKDYWADKFLKTLIKFGPQGEPVGIKSTPGGRITANVGTEYKKATLINCFIGAPVKNATIQYERSVEDLSPDLIPKTKQSIEYKTDDNADDLFNIFLTIMEQAKTLASEGGYGLNFSFIRPRGSLIKGLGIRHPGVIAYMKIWDSVSECIVKGSDGSYTDKLKNYYKEDAEGIKDKIKAMARKGAMMGCLNVNHPDIEEFVRAKHTSGVLTKFNTSVVISDEFMEAVKNDTLFDLTYKGQIYKKVMARDLYDLIMKACYNRAEPGILFKDNIHRSNPLAYLGECDATNPCGEVPGLSTLTTVCLLGSFNLTQYVEIIDGIPVFNFKAYEEDIPVLLRMLDNVNDITFSPLPSYEWAIINMRQVGMGLNGLGSVLLMLGIPYNSQEALEFTEKLGKIKENVGWAASALLAKEKGTFPVYNKEAFENTHYFKKGPLTEETKNILRKYGARNGKISTNPPLGNSSIVCDLVSNGIEPIFSLEYQRKIICDKWPEGLNEDNVKKQLKFYEEKDFKYWQGEYEGQVYYYEEHNRGLCKVVIVRDYSYQWILDNFPDRSKGAHIQTAHDLEAEDHVKMQAAVQKYVSQSVSKTCNVPKEYPYNKFKNLYMSAWENNLAGFTAYRQGCMESVLSDIEKAETTKEIISRDIKLPDTFNNGPTKIIKKEGCKFYMNFSYLPEDGEMRFPVVFWIYTNAKYKGEQLRLCNKASRKLEKLALECGVDSKIVEGTVQKAHRDYPHNRLGRLISLCLRHNIPRVDILSALMNLDGDNISTLITAVRKFLSETIPDGTRMKGLECENPDCRGSKKNIILISGCKQCEDCGWQSCG